MPPTISAHVEIVAVSRTKTGVILEGPKAPQQKLLENFGLRR
jgi:hypothetical protein